MKVIDTLKAEDVIESLLRSGWERDVKDEKYFINTLSGRRKLLSDELKKHGIKYDKK